MSMVCPKCAYERKPADGGPDYECPSCGIVYAKFDGSLALKNRILRARSTGNWQGIPYAEIPAEHRLQAARGLPIATTDEIPGRTATLAIDVVSAECAYGMNIFRDALAGITDVVGGRSGATQNVLRDARINVLMQLRLEALSLGAHGVVGVKLDYNEFSGGGKSMLFVAASGTAVQLSS